MLLLILYTKVPGISADTGLPYFIALQRYCIFYKLEVYVTLMELLAPFPTAFAHSMPPCPILVNS